METIVFATANKDKAAEIASILKGRYEVKTLIDIGILEEIAETGETLKENAYIKAKYVYDKTGLNCFADDTGLLVDALNDAPGVYSARYAGLPKNDNNNIDLLLKNLENSNNRNARFQTVICYMLDGDSHYFTGELTGKIISERIGENGFGYDPVFVPAGYSTTLAQMSLEEKNSISHRARAIEKLSSFLLTH